jgi:membrane protease YdiL (CAAX protease family)
VPALHLLLLFCLLAALPRLFPPGLTLWPWKLLLPLLAYLAAVAAVPALRATAPSFRLGRLGAGEAGLAVLLGVAGAAGLAAWVALSAPDLGRHARLLPPLSPWLLLPAGAAFAVFNAALEETVFRGAIFGGLEKVLASPGGALLLQALLFGALHYRAGFPNGAWGVVLTAAYGLGLGWLRRRSGGLAAPWLAHALADAAVFALVVRWAGTGGGA